MQPAKLQSIRLQCTRLSFQKTSTTFRSDAGASLKHGDKHLMQSRYWLWSVPAVLLRRNCRFGFNAKIVHQLWTKQKRGRFFLRKHFFQRMLWWGPPHRGLWSVPSQDLVLACRIEHFGAQFLGPKSPMRSPRNEKHLVEKQLPLVTPPKFNIAAEKWCLQDYFRIGEVSFQGLC